MRQLSHQKHFVFFYVIIAQTRHKYKIKQATPMATPIIKVVKKRFKNVHQNLSSLYMFHSDSRLYWQHFSTMGRKTPYVTTTTVGRQ